MSEVPLYSLIRTRTAPRKVLCSQVQTYRRVLWRCVSLVSSNPCMSFRSRAAIDVVVFSRSFHPSGFFSLTLSLSLSLSLSHTHTHKNTHSLSHTHTLGGSQAPWNRPTPVKVYLAHKKEPSPRTLPQDYA